MTMVCEGRVPSGGRKMLFSFAARILAAVNRILSIIMRAFLKLAILDYTIET